MVTAHPGLGAQPQQFVLDTQTGQSVTEVTDGLVVVEVSLGNPAFGPLPVHDEPAHARRIRR